MPKYITKDYPGDPVSTLAGAIDTDDLTITVASGHGSRFASPGAGESTVITLGTADAYELVEVESRSGDVLTASATGRGWGVSSPASWPIGTPIQTGPPAEVLNAYLQAVDLASYATSAALTSGLATKQASDADLTTLAGLGSGAIRAIASDGAGWLAKTVAEFKTWLGLVKADVGLGNVDNTSDANKPVSTAQAAADTAVYDAAAADLAFHVGETLNVHGIPDTAELPYPAFNEVAGVGLESLSAWQRLRLFYNLLNGSVLNLFGSQIAGIDAILAAKEGYLPDPAVVGPGYLVIVKDTGFEATDYPCTIYPHDGAPGVPGAVMIDNQPYYQLAKNGDAVAFFTDGTNYFQWAGPNLRFGLVETSGSYTVIDPIKYIVWTGATAAYPGVITLPDITGREGQEHTIKNEGSGAAMFDGFGVNEVQTITVVATGGTFTVTFEGQTTTSIAFNAAASTVTSRLEALSNVGVGDVTVQRTGAGTSGNPYIWTVTFTKLLRKSNRTQMTSSSSLTGTGNSIAHATTTQGYCDNVDNGSGVGVTVPVGDARKVVARASGWMDVT